MEMEEFVHKLFERTATKFPDKIAIEFHDRALCYHQLNAMANRAAHDLTLMGVAKGDIVCVLLPPGVDLAVAMLAIFKTGAIYLPIDPKFPTKKVRQIFENSYSGYLVTDQTLQAQLFKWHKELGLDSTQFLLLGKENTHLKYDKNLGEWEPQTLHVDVNSYENPDVDMAGESGNYIFYTSGSTGEGKAMLGRHNSLSHFIQWQIKEFGIDHSFKVSQLLQPTFDGSMRDYWVPLCSGATLCIPQEAVKNNMHKLAEWMEMSKISLVHCVPTQFRVLLKEITPESHGGRLNSLKQVVLAGEQLYAGDILKWRASLGETVEFVNLYGTSETTLAKTFHRIGDVPNSEGHVLHVGKPMDNSFVIIVNDNNELCKIGERGEIYIKTRFMTNGYWKNDKENQLSFVQNPLVNGKKDIVHKTGDVGRYLKDRSIEVLGRLDKQVKVNGVRTELNEVKSCVLDLEHVTGAEIIYHTDDDHGASLICYYTGVELKAHHIREQLTKVINETAIPSWFVHVEEFPLTLNGKIDKKRLVLPGDLEIVTNPPRTPTEIKLTQIWKELLKINAIGRDKSFFTLGGNSLKALQLISRVYKTFGIEVKLSEIFTNQTIGEIALLLEGEESVNDRLQSIEQQEYYQLSSAQKRLWVLENMGAKKQDVEAPKLHIYRSTILPDGVDVNLIKKAFQRLLLRHESLRTVFVLVNGEPRQKVLGNECVDIEMTITDLQEETGWETKLNGLADQDRNQRFNLETGPLIRVRLVRIPDGGYTLHFVIHHIIADGWSINIIEEELLAFYEELNGNGTKLTNLDIQYRDYAAWQNNQLHEKNSNYLEEFWLQQFKDGIPELNLPMDYDRSSEFKFVGERVSFTIPREMKEALSAQLKALDATMFMLVYTVYLLLLHKLSGQDEITIGVPVTGRNRLETEKIVGMFLNTLAVKNEIEMDWSLTDLLKANKRKIVMAFDHQAYPFEQLINKLNLRRGAGESPLFNSAIIYHNYSTHEAGETKDDLSVKSENYKRFATNDITLHALDLENGVACELEYRSDLFTKESIELFAIYFQEILSKVIDEPNSRISDLKLSNRLEAATFESMPVEFNL